MKKILNYALSMNYLNVQPEFDEDIEKYSNWSQDSEDGYKVYLCLGYYDYVVFNPTNSHPFPIKESIPGPILGNYLISSMGSICYGWEDLTKTLNSPLFNSNVISITHLKYNSLLFKRLGIDLESTILEYITDTFNNSAELKDNYSVMGRFGWGELLLLNFEADLSQIPKPIFKLRSTSIEDLYKYMPENIKNKIKDLKNLLIFETSFTVIGYNRDLIKRKLKKISEKDEITFRISIFCRPGCLSIVYKKVLDFFGTGQNQDFLAAIGKEDIIIERKFKFSLFLNKLWGFRNKASNYILGTETVPYYQISKYLEGEKNNFNSNRDYKITKSLEISPPTFIRDIDSYLFERFMNMIADINSRITNPIDGPCFQDILSFVRKAILDIDDKKIEKMSQLYSLSTVCDLFSYGFQQRFIGSYSSMYNINAATIIRFNSGIQRIINAAHYIIEKSLLDLNQSWNGFVIFGERDHFQWHSCGVINIPFAQILNPEEWWQLFHEIGHEYLQGLSLDKNETFYKLVKDNLNLDLFDEDVELKNPEDIEFLEELGADIFEYYYGFKQNFTLYLKVSWLSIIKRFGKNDRAISEYILRSMFINWVHYNSHMPDALLNHHKFQEAWVEMIDEIRKVTKKSIRNEIKNFTSVNIGHIWNKFTSYFKIQRLINEIIVENIEKNKKYKIESEDFSSIFKGIPIFIINNPIKLIYDITDFIYNNGELVLSQRIASILSLCSSYQIISEKKEIYRFTLKE
jgi:hypothetical protein